MRATLTVNLLKPVEGQGLVIEVGRVGEEVNVVGVPGRVRVCNAFIEAALKLLPRIQRQ